MKRFIFLFIVFCGLQVAAQSEQALLEEAQKLEASLNEVAAFEKVKQAIQVNPSSYAALWKASEFCSRLGALQSTDKRKLQFYMAGKDYADKAIKVNPSGADGYYAKAIAMGRLAQALPAKDKISAVKAIKTNADMALKYNPKHAGAWHVLGKWYYEVSNLNVFEKAGVKLFFGGLPAASIQQSIKAYEKAAQLQPDFALNYLELAKAYKYNEEDKKAIVLLQKLPNIPVRSSEDYKVKEEGKQLLKEWNN